MIPPSTAPPIPHHTLSLFSDLAHCHDIIFENPSPPSNSSPPASPVLYRPVTFHPLRNSCACAACVPARLRTAAHLPKNSVRRRAKGQA